MAPNKVESDLNDTFISLWQAKLYQNVDLPGIVVCGDQSSGKSSVLEAISSLKFPTNDGMCTRFVTRVEMAYAQIPSMTIQIDTDPSRSREECFELRKWAASIKETDFAKFGEIVTNVGRKLGTDRQGGFLRDALIVQAHGPKLPFFTFIDLPGLIHAPRDDQDMSDIDHIEQLVKGYLLNPRMIILAIVSAKSDLEIQGILKFVLEHDSKGERTIGVITKPDYCDESPTIEKQAIKLLTREGSSKYHFHLGWHVIKNLKQKESHFSRKQRDDQEKAFLRQSPWDKISQDQKGAASLAIRLQKVLLGKFTALMPKLMKDIQNQIRSWRAEQDSLKSGLSGIADPWKDFQDRLVRFQKAMVKQTNYKRKDDFICDIENLAKEFSDVIYVHGHAFEYDHKVLVGTPRTVHSRDGYIEWTLQEKRSLEELYKLAADIVTDANSGAGQLTDTMYNQLYQMQTIWPQLLQQYIEKIQEVLGGRLAEICDEIWPPVVSEKIGTFLGKHAVEAFAMTFQAKAAQTATLPEPNSTVMKDAMGLAWRVELERTIDERIQEACKVDSKIMRTPKRDSASLAAKVKQEPLSPILVVARQAIAVMQVMYLEQIDEIKPAWSAKQIIVEMTKFFEEFPQILKTKLIFDEVLDMYGGNRKEDPKAMELADQIASYEGCLAKLRALEKLSER